MSTKDSPHDHSRRPDGSHEARRRRESWEQDRLRELGLDDIHVNTSLFCAHCRREMLVRLERAQARGSVLFDIVRRQGLSPLEPNDAELEGGGPGGATQWLVPEADGPPRWRRVAAAIMVAAAIACLALWAALVYLRS